MTTAAFADQAKVENATAQNSGATWTFEVTISHPDTGWDHYADGWAVLAPDGTELGYRTLHHPHENEQPFTRSLSGVSVPSTLSEVKIRAHDSVHGWSDQLYTLRLK
ncbi:MAG: hypothetical protein AAF340_09845 [Pseudomonadota bacterium]